MGTSGGGSGSGGSGGAGGGGGGAASSGPTTSGGGYGTYTSSGAGSGGKGSRKAHARRNVAQTVLGRLKPAYLLEQFASSLPIRLVHELALLRIDIVLNKSWKGACERMGLPVTASPSELRDEILRRAGDRESDSRIRETSTATFLSFFEELCGFDDDVLYGKGNKMLGSLVESVINEPLENFLRLHYINVLQREEPKLLDSKSQGGLETVAADMAHELARRLRNRYGGKDQSSEGDFLMRAGSKEAERTWLLTAIRG